MFNTWHYHSIFYWQLEEAVGPALHTKIGAVRLRYRRLPEEWMGEYGDAEELSALMHRASPQAESEP